MDDIDEYREKLQAMASDPAALRNETEEVVGEVGDGDVGGHLDLSVALNLNAIAIGLGLENIEYEPEKLPALVYRIDQPDVTVLLFGDGQITVLDADDEQAARNAATKVADRLEELGLVDEDTPGADAVATATSR